MTVTTVYPDANVETNSVDGFAAREVPEETWASLRGGAGNTKSDNETQTKAQLVTGTTTDRWTTIHRCILLFYTEGLPDGDVISAATMEFVGVTAGVGTDFSDSISMVTSTPASDVGLVNADYSRLGTTKQASDIAISGITANNSAFTAFTLNSTGLGNISKTGVTKFGIRITFDNDNEDDSPPTWSSADNSRVNLWAADSGDDPDRRPKLVITHASQPTSPGNIAGAMRAIGIL